MKQIVSDYEIVCEKKNTFSIARAVASRDFYLFLMSWESFNFISSSLTTREIAKDFFKLNYLLNLLKLHSK